ncbi:MAG TPA: polysaccharide biosynthesis/export family protein [Oligoflexia bacterium]|nr:polysaccharide biosynthesis/export family protein [Oligoflexia bacterium]HMP48303.1 polysaccharide biosynthesis/export family protein [Oligoflexia bacterium]
MNSETIICTKKQLINLLLIFNLVIIASSFQACLRFTPSRASLTSSVDGEKPRYEGEDSFFALEKRQKDRLLDLVSSRAESIKPGQNATYIVGIGDVLELFVFETDELNRKVRVRPDGLISLPLLGQIKVVGLTEEEIQSEITKKLNTFMHNPQVQVFIDQYAAHKVWVVGEIHKPGAYPLSRDNYSLIELLSEAGGRTERASSTIILIPEHTSTAINPPTSLTKDLSPAPEQFAQSNETDLNEKKVGDQLTLSTDPVEKKVITEATSGEAGLVIGKSAIVKPEEVKVLASRNGIEISFDDLIGSMENPPLTVPLRAGDTIVVPEAGKVQVDGEVKVPGSYALPSKMSLMGAIATAGGLSFAADVNSVEVIREIGSGHKAMITIDVEKIALQDGLDIRLRDGDLIRVPSARGRFAINQVVNVINSLLGRALAPIQTAAP